MNLRSNIPFILLIFLASCFPKEDPITPKPRLNKSVEIDAGVSRLEVNFFSLVQDTVLATANPMDWDLYYTESGVYLNGFRSMSVAKFNNDWNSRVDTIGLDFDFLTVNFEEEMWLLDSGQNYVVEMGIDTNYQSMGYYKLNAIRDQGMWRINFSKISSTTQTFAVLDPGSHYYSFLNNSYKVLPSIEEYDFALGKYTDYVIFPDEEADYLVFGALTGGGAAVELQENFDEVDASAIDTINFDPQIKTGIGWDWKWYNLDAGAYVVKEDLTYVIKTQSGLYYKLRFTGFYNTKGISGHPTFEYKLL